MQKTGTTWLRKVQFKLRTLVLVHIFWKIQCMWYISMDSHVQIYFYANWIAMIEPPIKVHGYVRPMI